MAQIAVADFNYKTAAIVNLGHGRFGYNVAMNLRRWLAALSFPCLILAGVLVYEAWSAQRGHSAPMSPEKAWLYYILAGVLVLLAMLGARERHRRRD